METEKKARVLIFTGDGKGKTTAALGMVVRASGHGMKTKIAQFVKGSDGSGELDAFEKNDLIEIVQTGCGFVPPPESEKFAEHKSHAENGLELAAQAIRTGEYDIVVLDEVCVAVSLKLLDEKAVIEVISGAKPDSVVVLTGRNAPEAFVELADTVTEMKCIKHGYKQGIKAQKGVEF